MLASAAIIAHLTVLGQKAGTIGGMTLFALHEADASVAVVLVESSARWN